MEYGKPEIVVLGCANAVIQGQPKAGGASDSSPVPPDHTMTINAYEADE